MKIRAIDSWEPVFDVYVVPMFLLGRTWMVIKPNETAVPIPAKYRGQLTITAHSN